MAPASETRALLLVVALCVAGCGAKSELRVDELPPCESDAECDDAVVCNGAERCLEGRCRRGEPPACDDDDPCTEDLCREEGADGPAGCYHPEVVVADADRDGYFVLGACGDDCDDADPRVNPGATEVCNGIDDDCDLRVDEGASYTPEGDERRLTFDPSADGAGTAAFSPLTGTWGVTYWEYAGDTADVWFQQLTEEGEEIGERKLLTREPGDAFGADMLWNGSEYALVWQDRRDGVWEIYFNRLTADGEKLAPDYRLTHVPAWSIYPVLGWSGEEYVVAWQDWRHQLAAPDNFEIYMTFLDREGFEIGDDIRLTNEPAASENPAIAFGPDEIGVAFVDGRSGSQQIYFLITDRFGTRTMPPVRLSRGNRPARNPTVVHEDDAFLVAWQQEGPDGGFDILGARVPREPPGPIEGPIEIAVGTSWSRAPVMLSNGDELVFSFSDDRSGTYDLYTALLDTRLGRVGEDVRVTHGPADSVFGGLARGATSIGVLFEDQRDGNWEVYFTRLLCVDASTSP